MTNGARICSLVLKRGAAGAALGLNLNRFLIFLKNCEYIFRKNIARFNYDLHLFLVELMGIAPMSKIVVKKSSTSLAYLFFSLESAKMPGLNKQNPDKLVFGAILTSFNRRNKTGDFHNP